MIWRGNFEIGRFGYMNGQSAIGNRKLRWKLQKLLGIKIRIGDARNGSGSCVIKEKRELPNDPGNNVYRL